MQKKSDLIPIHVECHAGYKADEYPRCFYWDAMRFAIKEIIDRWYEGGRSPDFPEADYFKVRTTDKKVYVLKHLIKKDAWYLWIRGENLSL